MFRHLILFFSLCWFSTSAFSGTPHVGTGGAGTTAANFLKLRIGAKYIGMGEAGVAAVDDANAIFWNPAGLTLIAEKQLALSHTNWLLQMKYENINYAQSAGISSAFGMAYSTLTVPPVTRTLENPDGSYGGDDGTYKVGAMLLNVGWGTQLRGLTDIKYALISDAAIGFTVKYLSQQIENSITDSAAVDIGYLYIDEHAGRRIGATFENIGIPIKKAWLPLTFRLGAIDTFWKDRFLVAYDLSICADNLMKANIGAEFRLRYKQQKLMIRAGYKLEADLLTLVGISVGGGLYLKAKWLRLQLDYAYVPFGVFGSTHRFTLLIYL